MLSRSVWRNLGYNARRRTAIPEVPYRCFSCSQRAQVDSNKANQDERMTHFGFSNVPESQKESMGMLLYALRTIGHRTNQAMPPMYSRSGLQLSCFFLRCYE